MLSMSSENVYLVMEKFFPDTNMPDMRIRPLLGHVEPPKPLQTHVQVKRMSDVSCDIWDLE